MRRRFASLLLIPLVLLAQALGGAHSHAGAELPHFHLRLLPFWSATGHGHAHAAGRHAHPGNPSTKAHPDTSPLADDDDDHEDAVVCAGVQVMLVRPTSPQDTVATSHASWPSAGLQAVPLPSSGCDAGPQSFLAHSGSPPHSPLFLRTLNLRI
jgi:hypothetical protein